MQLQLPAKDVADLERFALPQGADPAVPLDKRSGQFGWCSCHERRRKWDDLILLPPGAYGNLFGDDEAFKCRHEVQCALPAEHEEKRQRKNRNRGRKK